MFWLDLIKQAEDLLDNSTDTHNQAAIRRAISNAYYAVFQMIVQEGIMLLLGTDEKEINNFFERSFEHSAMKIACEDIRKRILPLRYNPIIGPFPKELVQIAIFFVELQKARHEADYNFYESIPLNFAKRYVEIAAEIIANWNAILETDPRAAKQFVTLLLLQKMKRN
jgi:hypothetical protein